MSEPRHEFYETDELVAISIFDKGAAPEDISLKLNSRSLVFEHGDKKLVLDPLTGEIDPEISDYMVGKFKIEVRLRKKSPKRWVRLVGRVTDPSMVPSLPPTLGSSVKHKPGKNWEVIAEEAINAEPEKSNDENPNTGDAAVSGFFQKLFANADDDTKRAMMKSFQESGGTALSTNWADVRGRKVEVKTPEGSEWRKWD